MKTIEQQMNEVLSQAQTLESAMATKENFRAILSMVDATTLSPCDTEQSVRRFARDIVALADEAAGIPYVASICVFPPFVESVGMEIDGTPLQITSVSAGFPASQTFLEVKALETAMAIESGADEIDVVISVGKMQEGLEDEVRSECEMLRGECEDAILKVILETGELKDPETIYRASMLAMEAGTDFIKTSTGKVAVSATPEAFAVMALAARDFAAQEGGRKVGLKVAGGIKTAEDAIKYLAITKTVLGEEWLNKDLLRYGTSGAIANIVAACK